MTQAQLQAYVERVSSMDEGQLRSEIYLMLGDDESGVAAHCNNAVIGFDVKDDLVKLAIVYRAYLGKMARVTNGVSEATLDAEVAEMKRQLIAEIGNPIPAASSTAGMTDHTKIYIYTGTTGGGLTNGHWCYWNGTAWTDGGGFVVDDTLSVLGAAADAKKVGDIFKANSVVDVLDGVATRANGTHNNVTYTWHGNVCTITTGATAPTAYSVNVLVGTSSSMTSLPSNVIPGRSYHVKCKTSNENVRFRLLFQNSSEEQTTYVITANRKITVPSDAVAWQVAVQVKPAIGANARATISDIAILTAETNRDLSKGVDNLCKYNSYDVTGGLLAKASGSHNGVNYNWIGTTISVSSSGSMTNHEKIYVYTGTTTSALTKGHWYYWSGSAWSDGGVYSSAVFDKNVCIVTTDSGGATNYSVNVLLAYSALPYDLIPGKNYYVRYNTSNENVLLRIMFKDSSGTETRLYFAYGRRITVPENATEWTLSLYVVPGTNIGGTAVSEVAVLTAETNEVLTEKIMDGRNANTYTPKGLSYYAIPDGTESFDAKTLQGNSFVREKYSILSSTFDGMNPPARLSDIGANTYVTIEKHITNVFENFYWLDITCDFPFIHYKVLRCYDSLTETYFFKWLLCERKYIYVSDMVGGGYFDFPTDEYNVPAKRYFRETERRVSISGYHAIVIPVKKGDSVYLRTYTDTGKAYAKITCDYNIDEISTSNECDELISFNYNGYLAFNIKDGFGSFLCYVDTASEQDILRQAQFVNALPNPSSVLPEYDDDNVCRVLQRGATWMGAIHSWGIIGASFDSGEFNFTRYPVITVTSAAGMTDHDKVYLYNGTTTSSMINGYYYYWNGGAWVTRGNTPGNVPLREIDWYEYSCWKYLQRINGIPDMYCYSDGGQNARDWIKLTNTHPRGHAYDSDEEAAVPYWPYRSGIGHDGGCWWKMLEDYQNGDVKQAFVLNLGGNDINNENPHDANWNEYAEGSYDASQKYKCGTIADIGTYDLATDTDTVPTGKTSGVAIPGIVNSFAGYMGAILNRLIAIQPDCKIFLCTIHNMYANNEKRYQLWNEYNDLIRQLADPTILGGRYAGHVFLLDAAKYGPNFYTKPQVDFWVGYHPNAIGYTYMAWTWNTMIDYAIQKNLGEFKQSMFIGTDKKYTALTAP